MTRRLVNDPRRPGDDPGLWIEVPADLEVFAGRPALFLDRDGVINVDSGYPARPEQIVILEAIVEPIRAANRAGWPVVVVTNQSGIAQGFFGWDDFADVTAHIHAELGRRSARLDLVLGCAYYRGGQAPLDVADHPMRKPNPGMLLAAAALAGIDLDRSLMVGDRDSDFAAAAAAGVGVGFADKVDDIAPALAGRPIILRPVADLAAAIG